eukprot:CAMPEP_0168403494 /NCGR_PEP_ID=MMETSP0228-20121227/24155_1 /TAXON_ID=133427 /ORGANISM="Protoceratium reticulatum, Strain CCCM 535 (=CCMP 1889)" /LENGTH=107 /DNA_ID=CAMNT_0008417093 /DNA_START=540 /DNA_END=863 /DNA_ORIENTATION=+
MLEHVHNIGARQALDQVLTLTEIVLPHVIGCGRLGGVSFAVHRWVLHVLKLSCQRGAEGHHRETALAQLRSVVAQQPAVAEAHAPRLGQALALLPGERARAALQCCL